MNKFEAIVFNSHGVGQYAYTDRMPVWGETLSVKNWHIAEDGGKGTNVSVALGRLGIKTAYIGKVGNDAWGDLGEKWMQNAGVDTTFLYRTDEVPTGTGLILIGPNGMNSIIDGDSSSSTLTITEVRDALDAMSDSEYFITGFEVPWELSLNGAAYAKSKGMKVALNPSPLPKHAIGDLSFVDYLFINTIEGRHLMGLEYDQVLDEKQLIHKLQDLYGCKSIIMTRAEQGSLAFHEGVDLSIDAIPLVAKDIVNTAGAGDGFMAATISRLIRGESMLDALKWASYYATFSITFDGTIPAYRPLIEVEAYIKSRTE
jgi:ribokinase